MVKKIPLMEQLLSNEQFMRDYNTYNKIVGGSLVPLKEKNHTITGREQEILLLQAVLERPLTPVALLLGQAGVGKTALVEEYVKQLNNHTLPNAENDFALFALRIGQLASIGVSNLQARLSNLLLDIKQLELSAQRALNNPKIRFILFIDEVHMMVTIFGPGTKIGGDVIKDLLARSPIRVIAATTKDEYDSTIAPDKPLSERFKVIELQELPQSVVERVAVNWWRDEAKQYGMIPLSIIKKIIQANRSFRSDSAEPRKTLDILEDCVSFVKRNGKMIDDKGINNIFKQRYSINLAFKVKADEVYGEIKRRILGQPHALYTLRRLLRSTMFKLDINSNRPIFTALFTGPTGVGKSLPTEELTPTINGFKKNGDIKEGDYVFNRLGRPKRIQKVFPQGLRSMFRVILEDGREKIVDGEHLISYCSKENLKNYKAHSQNPKFETRTLGELLKNSYFELNEDGSIEPNFYLPQNGAVEYDEREFVIDPYYYGVMVAITDNVRKNYGQNFDEGISEIYKISSIKQRQDLLSGIFNKHAILSDDGNYDIIFETNSRFLFEDVREILYSLGISLSYESKSNDDQSDSYIIKVGGSWEEKINIFNNSELKSLDQKQIARIDSNVKEFIGIKEIVPIKEKMDAVCFLVEDDEHLFQTTKGYVVTHNTETTKAIAYSLYKDENVLLNINMPDYKLPEHDAAFRKKLGETIRHKPNSIILLDELEKAHESIKDSLLAILDEGIVNFDVYNREGAVETHFVSLRNSIVIATTNEGHQVFQDDARFSSKSGAEDVGKDNLTPDNVSKAEIESLGIALRNHLQKNGFKPELLGRFDMVIPYRGLSEAIMLKIAERYVEEVVNNFRDNHGIEILTNDPVRWPIPYEEYFTTDLALYMIVSKLNSDDTKSGGARSIRRAVNEALFNNIVDAIIENEGYTKFKAEVDKQSRIYDTGVSYTDGGINVLPIE